MKELIDVFYCIYVKVPSHLGEVKIVEISGANYGPYDVFFQGAGSYHLFRTCNNWANQALQTTGVKTPIWSPFEYAIFNHVKNR